MFITALQVSEYETKKTLRVKNSIRLIQLRNFLPKGNSSQTPDFLSLFFFFAETMENNFKCNSSLFTNLAACFAACMGKHSRSRGKRCCMKQSNEQSRNEHWLCSNPYCWKKDSCLSSVSSPGVAE